jgi:hypothetical protein
LQGDFIVDIYAKLGRSSAVLRPYYPVQTLKLTSSLKFAPSWGAAMRPYAARCEP